MSKHLLKILTHGFLVALVLSQGPAAVMADEEARSDEGANVGEYQQLGMVTDTLYRGLDRFYFMIIPLVNAGVGSFLNGPRGAVVGFFVGGLDELLMHIGIEDAYYFTSALLGVGVLDKLALPYHIHHVAGALGGVGIASGQLDSLKGYVGSPVQGAVNGLVYGGMPGAIAGGLGGALDEVLKAADVTAGDYCSKIALGFAQSKALGTAAGMIAYLPKIGNTYQVYSKNVPWGTTEGVAALLIAFKIYNQSSDGGEDSGAAKTSFDVIEAFDDTLSQVIDPNVLHTLMKQQAVVMVALPLLSSQIAIQLQKYCQDFDTQLAAFKDLNDASKGLVAAQFFEAVTYLTIFLVPYVGEFFVTGLLNDYQGRKLAIAAQDSLHGRLVQGEMPLKLARSNQTAALIDAMDANLYSVAATGERLLSKIAESQVKGVFGLCVLSRHHALDFAVIAQLLDELLMTMGIQLSEMQSANQQAMLPLKSKISSLQKEWHKNPRDIVCGDKQALLAAKEAELMEEIRLLSKQQAVLQSATQAFFTAKDIFLNFVVKYGFMARKMLGDGLAEADKLPFAQYSTIAAAGRGLLESYGWYSQEAGNLMEFNQARMNLKKLIGIMDKTEEEDVSSLLYATQEGSTNEIELSDFAVGHDGGPLLKPQTLIIPQGIYVVSGASGSGKTSFLSKLQGIQYNSIWGKGKVTYQTPTGQAPIIHQATQVDYIVPYTTLMEVITSQSTKKTGVDVALEGRVKDLLREIIIDDKGEEGLLAELHAEKEWATILSGGQKRKIAIIGAILKRPNVVILDEVFNGLDAESVKTAQRMLKHYLPDTLMLIVDHNYELNNYVLESGKYFYDGQLNLEDQGLLLRQL